MTYELDSLLRLYNSKTYLKPDTGCNMPDVNPVYDKEVYKERLSRIPSIIEMPYNDVIQNSSTDTSHLRRSVSYMLGASNFYMPVFEQALETYGLPLELKYLPVIESGLNPKQFPESAPQVCGNLYDTGKRYGLEVNSLVDERRDLVKASYAAANYLVTYIKSMVTGILSSLLTNAGPDKINKAIHRSRKDKQTIGRFIPSATRDSRLCPHSSQQIISWLIIATTTFVRWWPICQPKAIRSCGEPWFASEQISHVLGNRHGPAAKLDPQYRHNVINGNTKPSSLRLPAFLVNKFIDNRRLPFSHTIRANCSTNGLKWL